MLDYLRRAETLAQELGDSRRLGRIYAEMGLGFWVTGDVGRALDYCRRTLSLATQLGHRDMRAWAQLSLGQIYYDLGNYPRAIRSLKRNVARREGPRPLERFGAIGSVAATSRAWLSYCHAERGEFAEGIATARAGLRIAETARDPFGQIEACYGVSVVYRRQGNIARAVPMLERAVQLCRDSHIQLFLPRCTAALGLGYALGGRVDAGLPLVEQGVEHAAARNRPRGLALVGTWLSEAYLLADRAGEASERAAHAVGLARQHGQRGTEAWALWLLGESAVRLQPLDVEAAMRHYRRALALAEKLGMRPLEAHGLTGLGALHAQLGRRAQARTLLHSAIELYLSMQMKAGLARAERELEMVADGR